MPYRMIIWAQDREDGKRVKGDLLTLLRIDQDWGSLSVPPRYVRVEVTDGATWENAHAWVSNWRIQYVFTTLDDQPTYAQYRVEVDPDLIAVGGLGRDEMKQEMRDFIEDAPPDSIWYGSTIDLFGISSMTVTVPKPHIKSNLKADFKDKFETKLGRRYYFKESGVDWALAQGGEVQVTQAQAINNLVDRLTE